MKEYDTAQICPNGHVTNNHVSGSPQRNQDYCERCGEQNLLACPDCNQQIRGTRHRVSISLDRFQVPAHCGSCGSPYPWTKKKIAAAIELASLELSEEDAEEFITSVNEIARDTPSAQVGATRIKGLLVKAGPAAAQVIRDIVVDVASEAAKKILLGGN